MRFWSRGPCYSERQTTNAYKVFGVKTWRKADTCKAKVQNTIKMYLTEVNWKYQYNTTALQAGKSTVRFPMGVTWIFHRFKPSSRTMALGSIPASNINEYQGCLLGVKEAGA